MVELITRGERIPPVRGLVAAHNAKGRSFSSIDLARWIRLSRVVYKTAKIDVLAYGARFTVLPGLFTCAEELDVRLSLRTDCAAPPKDLEPLKDAGLFDVFLCPKGLDRDQTDAWFEACREAGLPLRLQVQAPFNAGLDVEKTADRTAGAGVVVANVALFDDFLRLPPCRDGAHSRATLESMNALVTALDARDIEANLLGVPFCLATEENRSRIVTRRQFFLDHQQYNRESYELAAKLYRRGPVIAGKSVMLLLGQHTSFYNPIDRKLLPWLLEHPWLRARIWAWHKLTRHLRLLRGVPKAVEPTPEAHEEAVERLRAEQRRALGPVCGVCSLRRICDGETPELKRVLPGVAVTALEGEACVSPLHFAVEQRKYYDPIDGDRVNLDENQVALGETATDTMASRAPDREIDSSEYCCDGEWSQQLSGTVRWYSYTTSEKLSTPLARLEPPFTLSATFGGGIADYIGFSFGRHCKLVCPMSAYAHTLVLHVEADGRYVLLRDGAVARPVDFVGTHYVPLRLGRLLEPRLSLWNIDGSIGTQRVLLWRARAAAKPDLSQVKYSVLTVSTRFARRLQAALLNLAHQERIDLKAVEVVVAFVPGLDATGDVIESVRRTHPELRVVPSPFAEEYANAKGLLINESLRMASGQWVVLLDADILTPPDLFARLEAVGESVDFVVPDGRKMLTEEVTARILLGETAPWREWEALLAGPGETRWREAEGVPIGFCQCVRATCFEKVRYEEFNSFEGADHRFGLDMREQFGRETRLEGVAVLHLHHGGSQWYGARNHL